MKKIVAASLLILLCLTSLSFSEREKTSGVIFLREQIDFQREVLAQEDEDRYEELREEIQDLERKLKEARDREKTLSSQINYMDSQIKLTGLKIAETLREIEELEEEIASLSAKIGRLEHSLTAVSEILLNRIVSTYKTGKIPPFYFLFSSEGFSGLLLRAKYIKIAQTHDKKLMIQMQTTKDNFASQKKLQEEKKKEEEALKKKLEEQKITLNQQKKEKEYLLEVTRSDEKRYQELLAQAKAELEAIQSIIAGKGEETKVKDVSEGERIASIISGRSACSTGTHLHFEVVKDGAHQNPASYLKSVPLDYDYDTSQISETINATGSWNWPLNEPITVHQIYGETTWIKILNLWYQFHTGIDISSSDKTVKGIRNGTLYRGGIACGGGTLRYVKVDHQDEEVVTYYLHVDY